MSDQSDQAIKQMRSRMTDTLSALEKTLQKIRTGRAQPELLEGVIVDYFGTPTPLSGVASVNIEEARTLSIRPWDKSQVEPIMRAIIDANLGLSPTVGGEVIRVTLPPLSTQVREELVKQAGKEAEKARIAIRNHRRDCLQKVQEEKPPESALKGLQKLVQKHTDEHIAIVDKQLSLKRDALLEV